jgi:hypothetical protein
MDRQGTLETPGAEETSTEVGAATAETLAMA